MKRIGKQRIIVMSSKCSSGPYKSLHKHWENESKEEEFSRVI